MRYLGLALLAISLSANACLDAPLPTDPVGPTWSGIHEEFSDTTELTVWRYPCEDGDAVHLLATFAPLEGAGFVCGTSFDVIQGGVQYDSIRFLNEPGGDGSFCSDMLLESTLFVGQNTFEPNFDPMEAFTLVWDSELMIDVGRYRASDYDGEVPEGPVPLQGGLSDTWYDPARSGEGFVITFSENIHGPIAVIYWFTHLDGRQYWLSGAEPYEIGDTEISIDLIETTASGFGDNFDPDSVVRDPWGDVTITFEACDLATVDWSSDVGMGSGSFVVTRVALGLDRVDCEH